MKLKKYLIYPFLCLFLAGCYYCPGVWSDSPQAFTFTLDKYEAKVGDEITVDSGDVKIFDSKEFRLECYDRDSDKLSVFKFVKKINSSKAVFEVQSDAFSCKLNLSGNIKQEREQDCSNCDNGEIWYCDGESDKELTIVK